MPENTDRDTHFQNFAKLLQDELSAITKEALDHNWNSVKFERLREECIARRAYDLVRHALFQANLHHLDDDYPLEEMKTVKDIPDLKNWPPYG